MSNKKRKINLEHDKKREAIKSENIKQEKKKKRTYILITSGIILFLAIVTIFLIYREASVKEYDRNVDLYALEITKDSSSLEEFANNFTIDVLNGGDLDYSINTKKKLIVPTPSVVSFHKKLEDLPFYARTSNNEKIKTEALYLYNSYLNYKNVVLDNETAIDSNDLTTYKENVKAAKASFILAYNQFNIYAKTMYSAPDHFVF